jgi:hypothetical protein
LYRSKHYPEEPKPPPGELDPLDIIIKSELQTLIPVSKEAILASPDVSRVTNNSMVVFVQSDYSNTERRQLIRHTWGNHIYYGNRTELFIFVMFAVGIKDEKQEDTEHSLDLEMVDHNDILLLNIVDVYDSLTIKGLLTMEWIHHNLPHVDYIVKTDDDIFLNTFAWMNAIRSLRKHNTGCVIAGFVWTNPKVLRDGKYAVSKNIYLPEMYPSFCSGAGYILSRDSVAAILEASAYIPLLLRDDPYYTGILARAMGVTLLTFPKTSIRFEDYFTVNNLVTYPIMAIHGLQTRQWYRVWNGLRLRYRKGLHHGVKLRSLFPIEKGLQLIKLSQSLNKSMLNECRNEVIFSEVFLS